MNNLGHFYTKEATLSANSQLERDSRFPIHKIFNKIIDFDPGPYTSQ